MLPLHHVEHISYAIVSSNTCQLFQFNETTVTRWTFAYTNSNNRCHFSSPWSVRQRSNKIEYTRLFVSGVIFATMLADFTRREKKEKSLLWFHLIGHIDPWMHRKDRSCLEMKLDVCTISWNCLEPVTSQGKKYSRSFCNTFRARFLLFLANDRVIN